MKSTAKHRETRVLNNTPVKLKLDFEIIDEDYLAGTTVVFSLPDTLGFTDNQGTIQGIGCDFGK